MFSHDRIVKSHRISNIDLVAGVEKLSIIACKFQNTSTNLLTAFYLLQLNGIRFLEHRFKNTINTDYRKLWRIKDTFEQIPAHEFKSTR